MKLRIVTDPDNNAEPPNNWRLELEDGTPLPFVQSMSLHANAEKVELFLDILPSAVIVDLGGLQADIPELRALLEAREEAEHIRDAGTA